MSEFPPITAVEMDKTIIDALTAPLRYLREQVRRSLYRRAAIRVLVLGDSHVRVFEHWRLLWSFPATRFDIVYVPGGTASGIHNRLSTTGAYRIFSEALAGGGNDLVVVNLGEVDTACTLWRRAERSGKDISDLLAHTVKNYCHFLSEVHRDHALVVLSACLPTLADDVEPADEAVRMRLAVKATQRARTALALQFNADVATYCARHAIPYLNCSAAALGPDGVVRKQWVNQRWHDHHYARSPYARWIVKALRQLPPSAGISLR